VFFINIIITTKLHILNDLYMLAFSAFIYLYFSI